MDRTEGASHLDIRAAAGISEKSISTTPRSRAETNSWDLNGGGESEVRVM